MQINILSEDTIAKNLLLNISTNTGINNFSNTSKIKNISDIIATEMSGLSDSIDEVTSRMFTSTAYDKFLDANGSEFGVYRKNIPAISIKAEDQVAYIRYIKNNVNFPSQLVGKVLIEAGKNIEFGGRFNVVFLDDVVLDAGTIEKPVSIRIQPISGADYIAIDNGDRYRLDTTLIPLLSELILDFDKPIVLTKTKESDIDYRLRIELSKTSYKTGSTSAIENMLMDAPGVHGFDIFNYNNGIVHIYITTKVLEDIGIDQDADFVIEYIKSSLEYIGSAGVEYNVALAKPVNFLATYSYDDTLIDEVVATDAIIKACKDTYKYGVVSAINIGNINAFLDALLGENVVVIKNVSLFDESLDITLSSDTILQIPSWEFPVFSRTGISSE
jgi:uncharacterized phage protein gp47/JayE